MLRKVKLNNFVHFENVTIETDDTGGPMFFIGQNNTGKTSTFEAIRRCMSTSKNLSLSSAHDEERPMYVTCHFRNDTSHQPYEVISTLYRPAGKIKKGSDDFCLKFVFVKDSNTEQKACDIVKVNKSNTISNERLDACGLEEILDQIYKGKQEFSSTDFKEKVESKKDTFCRFRDSSDMGNYENTECEKLLKKYVDETTVITFPLRSISPYQWTNSNRLRHEHGAENIEQASKRAEILSWFLSEKMCLSETEKKNERTYFNKITNKCGFEFEMNDSGIIKASEHNGNGKLTDISLLKIPEGIFEAKRVAILLCLDRFKTLCLEDPDRGMHGEMIERLRDLVLYGIKDKTILITSHQPTVISPWTVPRTVLFQRLKGETGRSFRIKSLRNINTDGRNQDKAGDKTTRIISSNHFATIFFAKRVIFVEGEDDYLFFGSLKQLLLTQFQIEELENVDRNDCDTESLREFLCSLHIVQLIGEANKIRFHNVCKSIEIEHYLLLDKDAIYNNVPKAKLANNDENKIGNVSIFLAEMGIQGIQAKDVYENVKLLEPERIFVWEKPASHTKGDIECVVSDISNVSDLTTSLKDIHVHIHQPGEPCKTKKQKLFSDKDKLTSENITTAVEKLIETTRIKKDENQMSRLIGYLCKCATDNSSISTTTLYQRT